MAEPNEPPHPAEPPEDFLLRHLSLIERIATSFARLRRLRSQEVEDFVAWVKLKLVEDDYRRIRAYRGSCPPKAFLAVVIGRLGKDFLDMMWQRWRPCAEAQRSGPVAVLLDQLTSREGYTFDQACEELRIRHGVTTSRDDLEAYYRAFPHRTPRRTVGEENLAATPNRELSPEAAAMAREDEYRRSEIRSFLMEGIRWLPPDERIFLRLYLGEGLSIADIARVQKLDQKSLYRRRDKIFLFLREYLRDRGVGKDEIDPLF